MSVRKRYAKAYRLPVKPKNTDKQIAMSEFVVKISRAVNRLWARVIKRRMVRMLVALT